MNDSRIKNPLPTGTLLQGKTYHYRIEKALGQGTFGITYLASVKMQGALGELDCSIYVAVKEFFMKETNGREGTTVTSGSKGGLYDKYRVKFAREAENLSHLRHPNIVKVLESFEANNTVYYTMEYIDGGSLDERIQKSGGMPEEESVGYLKQIGSALSYMHGNKMLHLDLKPANIVLRKSGEAVLIDFGLSKQYDGNGKPETSTSVGLGTPGYAPIEQAHYRDGKDFPVVMDVYALGATFFKMLTGVRPPDASEILNDGFPAYELQKHNVSDSLLSVIAKAMAPMKKDRYQTVGELLDALTRGKRGEDTTLLEEEERTLLCKNEPLIAQPEITLNASAISCPFSDRSKCLVLTRKHIGIEPKDIVTYTYKVTPSLLEITFKREDNIWNDYTKSVQLSKAKYEALLNRLMEMQYYQVPSNCNHLDSNIEQYGLDVYSSVQVNKKNLLYKGKFQALTSDFEKRNSVYDSWKQIEVLFQNLDSGFNSWANSCVQRIEKKNTTGIYFGGETPKNLVSKYHIQKVVIRLKNYEIKECLYTITPNTCEFSYKIDNKTTYGCYCEASEYSFLGVLGNIIDLKLVKKYTDSYLRCSDDYAQILMYNSLGEDEKPLVDIWCCKQYSENLGNVVATPLGLYNQVKNFCFWQRQYEFCVQQHGDTEKITRTEKNEKNNVKLDKSDTVEKEESWLHFIGEIVGIFLSTFLPLIGWIFIVIASLYINSDIWKLITTFIVSVCSLYYTIKAEYLDDRKIVKFFFALVYAFFILAVIVGNCNGRY